MAARGERYRPEWIVLNPRVSFASSGRECISIPQRRTLRAPPGRARRKIAPRRPGRAFKSPTPKEDAAITAATLSDRHICVFPPALLYLRLVTRRRAFCARQHFNPLKATP
jgi:hypothetical protein